MLECPFCKKNLRCSNDYLQHQDSEHSSNVSKRNYPCPHCGIPFHNRKSFYEHMSSHSDSNSVESKRILCQPCHESFGSVKEIESHLELCEKSDKITCPFCQKRLTSMKNYRVHKHRWVCICYVYKTHYLVTLFCPMVRSNLRFRQGLRIY